jgi:hypothetical protein
MYRRISWALTRSNFGSAVKQFIPMISNSILPNWIRPRLGLAY